MIRTSARHLLAVALISVPLGAPAFAQERTFSVTPSIGVLLPATDLVGRQRVFDQSTGGSATVTLRHQVGPTLGVRGSARLLPRFALEAEMALALSEIQLDFASADRPTVTQNARVFALAANLRYELFRAPFAAFSAHALGGAGLVARGGEFFNEGGGVLGDLEGGSDLAIILGGGFRYGLDPAVSLRVDLRDYVSSYRLSNGDVELESKLQHDVWLSLGVEFGL